MRPRDISQLVIRAELMPETNRFTTRTIVAGFPGVGKSTAAKENPDLFLDLESSDYHWIVNDKGQKVCNPRWPNNYFQAILDAAFKPFNPTNEIYIYVLISTHKEILDLLRKCHIYYMAVVPKTKIIYIQRYIDRGSSDEFIESLNNNFEKYIKDIESSSAFGIHYTDDYLCNIYAPRPEDLINYSIDYSNFENSVAAVNEE